VKQKGCTIPIFIGIIVAAVITTTLRYSTTVAEFLYELGIENPIWQNMVAIILGIALGMASIYILNKIIKNPKPDNSFSLPVPMTSKKKQSQKSTD
jgi:H+/Cl- antiporter ClcA